MKIQEVINKPTVIDNIHESCFRSYDTLRVVIEMVERGDSKETIIDFYILINSFPEPVKK